MIRYGAIVALLLICLLAIFLVAEELYLDEMLISTFFSPTPAPSGVASGHASQIGSALASIVFLSLDVLLPIPASVIMLFNGALFGVLWGSLISVVGGLCAGWIGFALGRAGSPWVTRIVTPTHAQRVNGLLARWGLLAVILTRPVPLLAEMTVLMAGASSISWWGITGALVVGLLPTALLYAMTGAAVWAFDSSRLTVVLVVVMAALFWLLQWWPRKGHPADDSAEQSTLSTSVPTPAPTERLS
jgi:uncharacterized membrane protein YdjX (TVP38/TMEM64 family)